MQMTSPSKDKITALISEEWDQLDFFFWWHILIIHFLQGLVKCFIRHIFTFSWDGHMPRTWSTWPAYSCAVITFGCNNSYHSFENLYISDRLALAALLVFDIILFRILASNVLNWNSVRIPSVLTKLTFYIPFLWPYARLRLDTLLIGQHIEWRKKKDRKFQFNYKARWFDDLDGYLSLFQFLPTIAPFTQLVQSATVWRLATKYKSWQ